MVMVVADSRFEAGRRPGGLYAPDEAFPHQDAQRVIHGLPRNRTDLRPDRLGDDVSSNVWLSSNRPQHCEALGSDLNAMLSKEIGVVAQKNHY